MIHFIGLDGLDFYYKLKELDQRERVTLVDMFDNIAPCNVKIVPSLPPYQGLGCENPTENDILFMTLNSVDKKVPVIFVNAERKGPLSMGGNPSNYIRNMRFKYKERICINVKCSALTDLSKYPLPEEGYAIKLNALKKIEKAAVPLVVTIDNNHQTWVHAYSVGNRFYFLYNILDKQYRHDSHIYKTFGISQGDLLFNFLVQELNQVNIGTPNKLTFYFL
jgi:hypothetical protein